MDHGDYSYYTNRGCRCDPCRKANAEYTARWRRKAIKSRKPFVHGTSSAYTNNGCRCVECKEARRQYKTQLLYGLSNEDVLQLFSRQDNKCGICFCDLGTVRWVFDHDHSTSKVRGVLCYSCNTAIAKFGEDPELILRAIQYLSE